MFFYSGIMKIFELCKKGQHQFCSLLGGNDLLFGDYNVKEIFSSFFCRSNHTVGASISC